MSPRALIGWPTASENDEAAASTVTCEWCREDWYEDDMVRVWDDVLCCKVQVCPWCADDPPAPPDHEAERARERARGIWPT